MQIHEQWLSQLRQKFNDSVTNARPKDARPCRIIAYALAEDPADGAGADLADVRALIEARGHVVAYSLYDVAVPHSPRSRVSWNEALRLVYAGFAHGIAAVSRRAVSVRDDEYEAEIRELGERGGLFLLRQSEAHPPPAVGGVRQRHRTPEFWDSLHESGYPIPDPSPVERHLFRAYTAPESGMRVIDVGCGQGRMTAHLANWGLRVTGYDFSGVAIETARAAYARYGDSLGFHLHDFDADAIPPELEPGSVDLVVCRLSLEFLDQARFLTDVRRWLKPGGILHVTSHLTDEPLPGDAVHHGLSDRQIEAIGVGWRHKTSYRVAGCGSPLALVLRR